MTNDGCLQVNAPEVIWERVDGEIVLVSFLSGCYYSIQGTGADIVSLLGAGHTPNEVVASLSSHHGLEASQVRDEVLGYVEQLVSDQLFVPCASEQHPSMAKKDEIQPASSTFDPPELTRFGDMADQLLLDPIHEMDSLEWPERNTA